MKRAYIIIMMIPLLLYSCKVELEDQLFIEEDILSIAQYIIENETEYSVFYQIMMEGQLKDPLNAHNPYGNGFTLFLPNDEAFERYIEKKEDYSSIEDLLNDQEFVRVLGRYHLVNTQLKTNEFPFGSLPDTTATGDLLTMGFSSDVDTTQYKVNNEAPVIESNLEMANGYIHIISEVLEPVNYSGYEWLKDRDEYSILVQLFELTGLKDTLGLYRTNSSGNIIKNKYTLFVEHDSIFERAGILSIEDLIAKYASEGIEYTDPDNNLFQFAAYHILEGEYFLADFNQNSNYNTYANAPIQIESEIEVKINPGSDTIRVIISDIGDTTAITNNSLYYEDSNILTKNGAIHFVSEILEFYTPSITNRTFAFYEEAEINLVREEPGTYSFLESEQDELEVISWTGPDELIYYKSSSSTEPASNSDYLMIDGNFMINYTIPKILPGRYDFFVRAHSINSNNEHATIIVYIDGKKMNGNYNLNNGGSSSDPYKIGTEWAGHKVGIIEFTKYSEHIITIESLIPGTLIWDQVSFILPE